MIPESDRLNLIRAEKKILCEELNTLSAAAGEAGADPDVRERLGKLRLRLRDVEERLEATQLAEDMERESDA